MDIQDLHLKESLLLCRRAEMKCAQRFRELAGRIPSLHEGLRQVILKLAMEEDEHLSVLDAFNARTNWPAAWHLTETTIDRVLREQLPALWQGIADGPVGSETALRYIESVESESSRFYRTLAECAPDAAAQEFFRTMSNREGMHFDRLIETLP
ncbi:MAG: hypothetical protein HYY16_08100 [Planctomycetes bacterium]|nr:hypothetical protein [Planctomycetota bacterium]